MIDSPIDPKMSDHDTPLPGPSPTALPPRTAHLAGIGGHTRELPEDFFVEELPQYEPADDGTHLYFQIEKRGLTTHNAVRRIARALNRTPREIGYAGLKDARAVTRQVLSLEHIEAQRVAELELDGIRVLWTRYHRNKLKLQHLRGNRFRIKVRDAHLDATTRACAIGDWLESHGAPNYFGVQRFGATADNAEVGQAALAGDFESAVRRVIGIAGPGQGPEVTRARELFAAGHYSQATPLWPRAYREHVAICRVLERRADFRRAWRAIDMNIRRLHISALQSQLFNAVLLKRLDTIDTVQVGDLAWKHANGACFTVENTAAEQPRCAALEISPSGPLFGRRMTAATGEPGRLEAEVLDAARITPRQFAGRDVMNLPGARRPLRIPVKHFTCNAGADDHGAYVELGFELPPGSYATVVLNEILK